MSDPKHRAVRSRGIKTVFSESGLSAEEYSDHDTWCGFCRKWIATPGVFGYIRFLGAHDDGACQRPAEVSTEGDDHG